MNINHTYMRKTIVLSMLLCAAVSLLAQNNGQMGIKEVMSLSSSDAYAKIFYGPDSLQFGELRLPESRRGQKVPVVVIIHGGCWNASIADLSLMNPMATYLTEQGYATWNLEYRRIGDTGGGWPGTFTDVVEGLSILPGLAYQYNLDLKNVVVTGHSAGGHLALWAASLDKVDPKSQIAAKLPFTLRGAVSQAGIVDLESYLVREGNSCGTNTDELVGGLPEAVPDRYQQGSPLKLMSTSVPKVLVNGRNDGIVTLEHVTPYLDAIKAANGKIKLDKTPGGHFEVIAPGTAAFKAVEDGIRSLMVVKAEKKLQAVDAGENSF